VCQESLFAYQAEQATQRAQLQVILNDAQVIETSEGEYFMFSRRKFECRNLASFAFFSLNFHEIFAKFSENPNRNLRLKTLTLCLQTEMENINQKYGNLLQNHRKLDKFSNLKTHKLPVILYKCHLFGVSPPALASSVNLLAGPDRLQQPSSSAAWRAHQLFNLVQAELGPSAASASGARRHSDCSLCANVERKFHCAWCSNQCQFEAHCQELAASTCPPPRIDSVSVWGRFLSARRRFLSAAKHQFGPTQRPYITPHQSDTRPPAGAICTRLIDLSLLLPLPAPSWPSLLPMRRPKTDQELLLAVNCLCQS